MKALEEALSFDFEVAIGSLFTLFREVTWQNHIVDDRKVGQQIKLLKDIANIISSKAVSLGLR
ncbi:hypothetical protein JCM19241_5716 [Vibrio ishigakensis]|uniref:Uncharacterized protein n=1 Tax=Vibrio ishigakensis TaxID=1481914 RepID=A0A0B8QAV4_9VIBR|nr:hypothetical protein JCM19241_5716 [Vibrio ishigakensis]